MKNQLYSLAFHTTYKDAVPNFSCSKSLVTTVGYFGTYISHANLASQWIALNTFIKFLIFAKNLKGVQNFLVHRLDVHNIDKTDLTEVSQLVSTTQ